MVVVDVMNMTDSDDDEVEQNKARLSGPGVSCFSRGGGLTPPNRSSSRNRSSVGSTSSKHFSAEAKFETQLQRALLLAFVRVL